MTGAMGREAQTLCYIQDLLLQGKISSCCDVVTQRLKGLEQVAAGGHFTVAQKQELVPLELHAMTSPMETIEASRVQREEMKAKTAASKPWERRNDWEKRDEQKGKGKSKDYRLKGKGKGDTQGHGGGSKDDKGKK